jgi:hypothetical protein
MEIYKSVNTEFSIDFYTTDLSEVTDKLYHDGQVVIGTDCIGSCKSNYHTITTTAAPLMSRYLSYIAILLRSADISPVRCDNMSVSETESVIQSSGNLYSGPNISFIFVNHVNLKKMEWKVCVIYTIS